LATDTNQSELVTSSVWADHFIQVAPSSSGLFLEQFGQLLAEHRNAKVYPAVNSDFDALMRLKTNGAHWHADFVLPAEHTVSIASDKIELARILSGLGVKTPRSFSADDVRSSKTPEKMFMKPRNGFGSRGARPISSSEAMTLPTDALAANVFQEVCDGPEVTVDAFHDAVTGDSISVCRERLEVKSGVCTKARLFLDKFLDAIAIRIGEFLEIRGSFCFQVMRSGGDWIVTDVNLRPGAGTALSCAIGADFFAAMHATRCGQQGIKHIDVNILQRGDAFVTRQYAEYVTRMPT
jgi:carbamoylphosphate synthase large subunit